MAQTPLATSIGSSADLSDAEATLHALKKFRFLSTKLSLRMVTTDVSDETVDGQLNRYSSELAEANDVSDSDPNSG